MPSYFMTTLHVSTSVENLKGTARLREPLGCAPGNGRHENPAEHLVAGKNVIGTYRARLPAIHKSLAFPTHPPDPALPYRLHISNILLPLLSSRHPIYRSLRALFSTYSLQLCFLLRSFLDRFYTELLLSCPLLCRFPLSGSLVHNFFSFRALF